MKNRLTHGIKIGEKKDIPQGWEISAKNDILTVQYKQISPRCNKTKKSL